MEFPLRHPLLRPASPRAIRLARRNRIGNRAESKPERSLPPFAKRGAQSTVWGWCSPYAIPLPLWGREGGEPHTPGPVVSPSPRHKGGESRSCRADRLLPNILKFTSAFAFNFFTPRSVIREIGKGGKGLLRRNFLLSIALGAQDLALGVCTLWTDRI